MSKLSNFILIAFSLNAFIMFETLAYCFIRLLFKVPLKFRDGGPFVSYGHISLSLQLEETLKYFFFNHNLV